MNSFFADSTGVWQPASHVKLWDGLQAKTALNLQVGVFLRFSKVETRLLKTEVCRV